MILLNFGHPLTADQSAAIEASLGRAPDRVLAFACQFDVTSGFVEQARRLLDGVDLTAADWQTAPLLVNLPSLAPIAACVLAELHGRCGYFPPIVRLRPVAGAVPPRFEFAEVIDLNGIREAARGTRG